MVFTLNRVSSPGKVYRGKRKIRSEIKIFFPKLIMFSLLSQVFVGYPRILLQYK